MSRSLPFRPSPEHLRNEARQLQRACHQGQADATMLLRHHLPRLAGQSDKGGWAGTITLQEAQFTLARDYGFDSWPKLVAFVAAAADRLYFTDQTKEVLEIARREAVRLGHQRVGTEHLLLGMLCDETLPFVSPLSPYLQQSWRLDL